MAQVSGVWVWNDSLPFAETAVAEYNLTFKSGNDNYTSLYVHDSDYDPRGGALLAYGSSGNAVYIGSGLETGFTNEVYKTIDFGTTPQTVSDNFYTYLTANATTTSTEQKAISLSNLEKFKELCDQTYAKTGGGSGGGTQLYRHNFTHSDMSITIISKTATRYISGMDVISQFVNNLILGAYISTSGWKSNAILCCDPATLIFLNMYYFAYDGSSTLEMLKLSRVSDITDTVTPL